MQAGILRIAAGAALAAPLLLASCVLQSRPAAGSAPPVLMIFEPPGGARPAPPPDQGLRRAAQPASLHSGARLMPIPRPFWPAPREALEMPEPISTCPRYVLAWPQSHWRSPRFEVFRWYRFPSILIFDTADYAVQDRMLKRIAFYVEKAGFRGRLARDEEIADLHGWNAHDYRAEDLARFFQRARDENFPLNLEELELEQMLLDAGLIWETMAGLEGGGGGS